MLKHLSPESLDSLHVLINQKGTLSALHCGGRAKRTTIDHPLYLEAAVRNDQAKSEQVVSIFFDIGNAHELTWGNSILMDLNEAGTERRFFKFHAKLSQT